MSAEDQRIRTDPFPQAMPELGVRLFESQHSPEFVMPPTQHPFPELLYIREGEGTIYVTCPDSGDSLPIECTGGDCVVLPAQVTHQIVDHESTPLWLYGLSIDPSLLRINWPWQEQVPLGKLQPRQLASLQIAQRLRRFLYLWTQTSPSAHLCLLSGAIETFTQLVRLADVSPQGSHLMEADGNLLADYLHWLDSNFFEILSLDQAAETCGLSRKNFSTKFRQMTGTTWLTYVNQLRVEHALRLLVDTDQSVTSIAFQSGFAELSTFYRVFKRVTGKRPLDYRK